MSAPSPEHVTRILTDLEKPGTGGERAAAELLPLLYDELRALARQRMGKEAQPQTLQATALVHEAYLRLVGDRDPMWQGRAHFFAAAARAMRRILVERARARGRLKRGGDRGRTGLDDVAAIESEPSADLVALDEALDRLQAHDKRKSEVVMLRHFAGLSLEETAAALDVSLATVKSDWTYAKAWLHRELTRGGAGDATASSP